MENTVDQVMTKTSQCAVDMRLLPARNAKRALQNSAAIEAAGFMRIVGADYAGSGDDTRVPNLDTVAGGSVSDSELNSIAGGRMENDELDSIAGGAISDDALDSVAGGRMPSEPRDT